MMEQKIVDELLKSTFTIEAFRKRYQFLKKRIEGRIYSQGYEGESQSGEKPSAEGKNLNTGEDRGQEQEAWFKEFDKNLLREIKNEEYMKLNAYVENFIKNIETLSLYFVFLPDDKELKGIGDWLRTNFKNPRLIFDIKLDPALIGGCAIAYKGIYRDFSLRARIHEKKDTIIQAFRDYMKNA